MDKKKRVYDKEKQRNRDAIYYQKNKEKVKKKRKEYYLKNIEECRRAGREYTKKWYKVNKERKAEYHKKYREENREVGRKAARKWLKKHPEERRKSAAEYRIKNRHKIRARAKIHWLIKKGILRKPNNCMVCGEKNDRLHGHHPDYNEPTNVIWCCSICHGNLHVLLKKEGES